MLSEVEVAREEVKWYLATSREKEKEKNLICLFRDRKGIERARGGFPETL